jgi:serine/threonine protein kinase
MSETAPPSRTGTRFGPYQLLRLLGRGGMGEVYEARDTVKNRVVALKLMSEKFSSDPVFRERMQREAHTAGRLQEPHIVPIHDHGEIDGQLFIDMRMVEGTDLAALLSRQGALPPPRAVNIIRQIAAALNAAHAAGVTHRDVKPENIIVTDQDFAYLVDFGIAAAAAEQHLTGTGVAIGSWNYMAPERFGDEGVNHLVDIYALACVLHECLTGATPYRADSLSVLMAAHFYQPIPRASQSRPGVPAAFDEVIARGMAKDPGARYPTARDLAIAADQALNTPDTFAPPMPGTATPPVPWSPTPPASRQSSSRPVLLGIAAVAIGALVVGGVWLGTDHNGGSGPSGANHTTPSATTTTPTQAMLPANQLQTILLSAAEINSAMGTSNLQPLGEVEAQLEDPVDTLSIEECRGALLPGQGPVYGRSGFTGVRGQGFNAEAPDYFVAITAVSFPSADQALGFVRTSASSWKACAGRTVTVTAAQGSLKYQFGDVAGDPPKIVQSETLQGSNGASCQHALSATSNVILDVVVSGRGIADQASRIANAMAAKMPK